MPNIFLIACHLYEPHAKEVLVNTENGWNDNGDGEVFLDERVIETQSLLYKQTIIVSS